MGTLARARGAGDVEDNGGIIVTGVARCASILDSPSAVGIDIDEAWIGVVDADLPDF